MRYGSAAAFRAALEARLLAQSKQQGTSLVRLRKSVAFDRLLARLLEVAPDRWVLKGGLALDLRLGDRTRTTMDIDLGRQDDEPAAAADFAAVQAADLHDHFAFAIERTNRLDELDDGTAVRYRAGCELAGRRFEDMVVDVAFGGPVAGVPDLLHGADLLAFAGVQPLLVPAIPLSQHVAEKVHAYTRAYGGGRRRPSTRVKDLVDLVLIARHAVLDASELRHCLDVTFESRARHPLPDALPAPPPEWRTPFRTMASQVGIQDDLRDAHATAASLVDPVLRGSPGGSVWDPGARAWR